MKGFVDFLLQEPLARRWLHLYISCSEYALNMSEIELAVVLVQFFNNSRIFTKLPSMCLPVKVYFTVKFYLSSMDLKGVHNFI